eukprot:270355-Prymnesium_polylepis.1
MRSRASTQERLSTGDAVAAHPSSGGLPSPQPLPDVGESSIQITSHRQSVEPRELKAAVDAIHDDAGALHGGARAPRYRSTAAEQPTRGALGLVWMRRLFLQMLAVRINAHLDLVSSADYFTPIARLEQV